MKLASATFVALFQSVVPIPAQWIRWVDPPGRPPRGFISSAVTRSLQTQQAKGKKKRDDESKLFHHVDESLQVRTECTEEI